MRADKIDVQPGAEFVEVRFTEADGPTVTVDIHPGDAFQLAGALSINANKITSR